jgi:dephospho-CoA kinase
MLRKFVPADERALLWLRPSPLYVVVRPLWALVTIAAATGAMWFGAMALDATDLATRTTWLGAALAGLVLLWEMVEWFSRLYVLTERRMICVAGVLRQGVADVPLRNVRNIVLVRGPVERLLRLGTLGAATAGTDGYELVWVMLSRPAEVLRTVRTAVDSVGGGGLEEARVSASSAVPVLSRHPLVIGLTGGVGAGKSEVARLLGEHGFRVIDSDKEAKAALDRPEVREELVKWWGEQVLRSDGTIDRRAVANIVFSDEAERTRLEQLVHPLVKADRAAFVDRAAREGKKGVVVDAPLLLEAGSDKECDVVVFVDSTPELRLARVRATRGWDQAELARRENAQLPLEEKRRRSDEVVVNDTTPEDLRQRVLELVGRLATRSKRVR